MANKDVYNHTVKIDKDGKTWLYDEGVEMEKPGGPVGYLLIGLLTCMGLTAQAILGKMKIDYEKVVMNGLLYMVDEKIRYGNRIKCTLSLEGAPELDEETKTRIAQISKKYCTVSVTIERNPEITLSME